MATILHTIFLNIISMKTYVIWLKLHWNLFLWIEWTICLHLSSSPWWVLNVLFLNLWSQIRFPMKCPCKKIYHFMNTHTLALLISRVCIYKHNLSVSIYILRRRKFIYLTMPTCFILLRFTHICSFSSDEIEIFIIIIIYDLIVAGWHILMSGL